MELLNTNTPTDKINYVPFRYYIYRTVRYQPDFPIEFYKILEKTLFITAMFLMYSPPMYSSKRRHSHSKKRTLILEVNLKFNRNFSFQFEVNNLRNNYLH
jgi:hypothetical protein